MKFLGTRVETLEIDEFGKCVWKCQLDSLVIVVD